MLPCLLFRYFPLLGFVTPCNTISERTQYTHPFQGEIIWLNLNPSLSHFKLNFWVCFSALSAGTFTCLLRCQVVVTFGIGELTFLVI